MIATAKANRIARARHPRAGAASRGVVCAAFLPCAALALGAFGASPALASGNENWANETISQIRRQSEDEGGSRWRGRRSAVEQLDDYMSDESEVRPRRQARRGDRTEEYYAPRRKRAHREGSRKVASLNRAPVPSPAHQNTIAADTKPAGQEAKPPIIAAEPPPAQQEGAKVASLGPAHVPRPTAGPVVPSGPIRWVASPNCLDGRLKSVLSEVARLFGSVRVNSTCRSKRHNARVGGATRSYHLTGNAVDFRIAGNIAAVSKFLLGKSAVGGFKHYGFGLFHIDTGPRRTWAGKARRSRRG